MTSTRRLDCRPRILEQLRTAAVRLTVVMALSACASAPAHSLAPTLPNSAAAGGVDSFSFTRDTFAFANLTYLRYPNVKNLYASRCFLLSRALRQFFQFAHFDPEAPRLTPAEYEQRVREVAAHAPWDDALPPTQRVVIPGYSDLREFSQAEEAAVKSGLGTHWWTLLNWNIWRVVLPVSGHHQEEVATEIIEQLEQGRLVQLLVTNLPRVELNHGVVAFAYELTPSTVEFSIWDPNDPQKSGRITFRRDQRRFWATQLFDVPPGVIRVFRMSYSALL